MIELTGSDLDLRGLERIAVARENSRELLRTGAFSELYR